MLANIRSTRLSLHQQQFSSTITVPKRSVSLLVSHAPARQRPTIGSLKPPKPVDPNAPAILSYDQLLQIKALRRENPYKWTYNALARKFKVNPDFARRVVFHQMRRLDQLRLYQELPSTPKHLKIVSPEERAQRRERLQQWRAKYTEEEHKAWITKEAHARVNRATPSLSFRSRVQVRRELFDKSTVISVPNPSHIKLDYVALHKELAIKEKALIEEREKVKQQKQQQEQQKQAQAQGQQQGQAKKGNDDKQQKQAQSKTAEKKK
jgi:hypothetical protein